MIIPKERHSGKVSRLFVCFPQTVQSPISYHRRQVFFGMEGHPAYATHSLKSSFLFGSSNHGRALGKGRLYLPHRDFHAPHQFSMVSPRKFFKPLVEENPHPFEYAHLSSARGCYWGPLGAGHSAMAVHAQWKCSGPILANR